MAWVFINQIKFYLHDDETLLAGLLRVGVTTPYQCQEGYCGTCKLKHQKLTLSSSVSYIHEPLLMLADDEILPCCCRVSGVLSLTLSQSILEDLS